MKIFGNFPFTMEAAAVAVAQLADAITELIQNAEFRAFAIVIGSAIERPLSRQQSLSDR